MSTSFNATRSLTSDVSLTDANDFFKSKIFLEINTIILGTVLSVDTPNKRLIIQSLINGVNSQFAPIIPPIIYDVPYGAIRGGSAGIITDFVIGDNVIIGFCQRQIDSTKNTGLSSTPSLYRFFSLQDAVVLSHWSNNEPSIYFKITNTEVTIQATTLPVTISTTGNTVINSNNVTVNSTGDVTINSNNSTINSITESTITAPTIALNGDVIITGTLTAGTTVLSSSALAIINAQTINAGTTVLSSSAPASIDGQPFLLHTHNGVMSGANDTGPVT